MAMTSSTALTAPMAAIFKRSDFIDSSSSGDRSDVTDSNDGDDVDDDDPLSSDDAAMSLTRRNFLMRMCDLNNCCLESWHEEGSATDVPQAEVLTLLMKNGRRGGKRAN